MNPVSANESTAAQYRQGVVLLATLGERQTIRYVLEEVAESIRVLEASGYQFKVLIVDDSVVFLFAIWFRQHAHLKNHRSY